MKLKRFKTCILLISFVFFCLQSNLSAKVGPQSPDPLCESMALTFVNAMVYSTISSFGYVFLETSISILKMTFTDEIPSLPPPLEYRLARGMVYGVVGSLIPTVLYHLSSSPFENDFDKVSSGKAYRDIVLGLNFPGLIGVLSFCELK